MKRTERENKSDREMYYETMQGEKRTFFVVHFDRELYDDIHVIINNDGGFTYEDVVKKLRETYDVLFIGDEAHPMRGNDVAVMVTPAEKSESSIKTKTFRTEGLKIVVSKKFITKNRSCFLNLIGKLFLQKVIRSIRGVLSYEANGERIFINLNEAVNGSVPCWRKIYSNYDNINCIFKYKKGDKVTLFCESKSVIYPVDEERDEMWDYFITFCDVGCKYPLPEVSIFVNGSGNVKIYLGIERISVLTRVIYGENLEEGLRRLESEMKNLGLTIKIVEKTKVRD